jgi:hypothetical protein
MKDDRLYLIHISECIARVEEYTTEGEAYFGNIIVRELPALKRAIEQMLK